MSKRTAVIAGSTGAIGRQLMALLIASPRFDKILVLHHRPTPYAGLAKVEQLVVDFAAILPAPAPGDDLERYSAASAPRRRRPARPRLFRGSTATFQSPWRVGRRTNDATSFVGISSVDARATASSVYLKTKGEMERAASPGRGLAPPTFCVRRYLPVGATSTGWPNASATGFWP